MPNSKQIVYLSQAQYAELIANGSITVDGVTVNYDENDIYVTPQAEPVTDVRVAGTSIAANGVANIPVATTERYGIVKTSDNSFGVAINANGNLYLNNATSSMVREGTQGYRALAPGAQHQAAFYGLTKAAGVDMKNSDNPVGTYTPEAKGAIQKMLGVSDLIATEENNLIASKAYKVGDVFTANGKLYKATAAIAADGAIITDGANANCEETSVGEGFVKFTDYADGGKPGIVQLYNQYGITKSGGYPTTLQIHSASEAELKAGIHSYRPVVPLHNHEAAFYGLAKAAGADEKDSTLPVGQYTDNAKSAIRGMLGAIGTEDKATASSLGLVKVPGNGIAIDSGGGIYLAYANDETIKSGSSTYAAITSANQNKAVFYGLAKAAGDVTQAASENAVGTYTNEAKSAIRGMLDTISINDIVPKYDNTSTYQKGDYCEYEGKIYFAKVVISTVEEWTADHWTETSFTTYASSQSQRPGLIGITPLWSGVRIDNTGAIYLNRPVEALIKAGNDDSRVALINQQHISAFYGLAKASGDTTQSASSNAVGVYTDNAKASIKAMLGIQDGSTGTVDISGTDPVIAAVENTRYVCGEVTSLNFTPPASGISIVRFTSGSTVTVLTISSTVKFPEWFDPTSLETNTIYEICVTDGEFGAVMSWAL